MNLPWTHEELEELKQRLAADIEAIERESPDIRPLPPMTESEAKEMLLTLGDVAMSRKLTVDESNLFGQLLCVFRMAVMAATLKRPGRCFVFGEEEIARMMKK